MIILKTRDDIMRMRAAGKLVAQVLSLLESKVKPGITTGELNALAEAECLKRGAVPVFKNYPNPRGGRPFPVLYAHQSMKRWFTAFPVKESSKRET